MQCLIDNMLQETESKYGNIYLKREQGKLTELGREEFLVDCN